MRFFLFVVLMIAGIAGIAGVTCGYWYFGNKVDEVSALRMQLDSARTKKDALAVQLKLEQMEQHPDKLLETSKVSSRFVLKRKQYESRINCQFIVYKDMQTGREILVTFDVFTTRVTAVVVLPSNNDKDKPTETPYTKPPA